jgi:HAD superfamily hydrolase (TIGR01509 family)
MTIKALIFDVDGTLAETEEVHRQAFNETFEAFGLDWHWDRTLYSELFQVTGGKERIRHYATYGRSHDNPVTPSRIIDLYLAKTARYTELVSAGVVDLRPGVERLIKEARILGVRLAIATSTSMTNVTSLLAVTLKPDGTQLFDVIAAGEMVTQKKPAPEIYQLVLERLDLPASVCIAIEDSYNGVMAARRCGIPVLATTSAYTCDEDLSYALAVLSDLGEPDAPFRHFGGLGAGETHVTIDALNRWHSGSPAPRASRSTGP